MFDYREFHRKYNENSLKDYDETIKKIKTIVKKSSDKNDKSRYRDYFNKVGSFILMLIELESEICEGFFNDKSLEELKEINEDIYKDILSKKYLVSFANPIVCVEKFGEDIGPLLSYLYAKIRGSVRYVYMHKIRDISRVNNLFIKVYDYIKNEKSIESKIILGFISDEAYEDLELKHEMKYIQNMDYNDIYWSEIIKKSDLNDLRYLFKFGEYIGRNEIEIAEYLNGLPQKKINDMADTMTNGYLEGFKRAEKSLEGKKSVTFYAQIGFERVYKAAIKNLEIVGLKPTYSLDRVQSTKPNKQFEYDHKFDRGLYLTDEYSSASIKAHKAAVKKQKDLLIGQSGVVALMGFGEKPFAPISKNENIKLTEEQNAIDTVYNNRIEQDINKYVNKKNWSFTIIAYPLPEIGGNFKDIFDATIKVNTLNSSFYEKVQQRIIDVLDKGDCAHVKGKGENKTDITIKLYELNNPERETIFENCIADVNIPVGEVFTSPV
jgi:aminopeptidase